MANITILNGVTENGRLTMEGFDTLIIETGGVFDVSGNNQTVRFTDSANGAVIVNNGQLLNTAAAGRAIRFEAGIETGELYATIFNNGTIDSVDDALQIDTDEDPDDGTPLITSGILTINNGAAGIWNSVDGQAIDGAGGFGDFELRVNNAGTITSQGGDAPLEGADAIRFQSIGILNNSGTINGGVHATYNGVDGVEYEDDTTGTVINSGTISGDRHAVNMGEGSNVTVTNEIGGVLTGRNGSGVGSDGTATVINHGTITGAFSDSPGSDVNGSDTDPDVEDGGGPDGTNDGDGDGVDIDGRATIVNFGTIEGTGAGGNGSDGFANTSEGIAAGGGTITNNFGGIISGQGLGILIDDSSRGNALFQTTITNSGTITGVDSYGIQLISVMADVIVNNGTISGGAGTAIMFGNGNNTLRIGTASVITGLTDGEGGVNTLDYVDFGMGGTTIDLASGAATGTGGVARFTTVLGSAGVDTMTGGASADTLNGRDGADVLRGGANNDILTGGAGIDILYGDAGNDMFHLENGTDSVIDTTGIDTITSTIGRTLTGLYAEVENLTLLGAGNGTGNGSANIITGSASANTLDGGLNNDTLSGLGGNDILIGNAGKDTMTGGTGSDTFRFLNKAHSVVGANADRITDFGDSGVDKIDVSALFGPKMTYIHAAAFTKAGQVRINDVAGADVIVEVNTVGTSGADFAIRLTGTTLASMTMSDFIL